VFELASNFCILFVFGQQIIFSRLYSKIYCLVQHYSELVLGQSLVWPVAGCYRWRC